MKKLFPVFIHLILFFQTYSQDLPKGPYYFVPAMVNRVQIYPDHTTTYGGIPLTKSFSLLARLLGDDPATLLEDNQTLVEPTEILIHNRRFNIQPFAYTEPGSDLKKNLPIGPNLQNFLNDPLGGASFDLSLPFAQLNIGLSDTGGFVREAPFDGFHLAIDFDRNGSTRSGFDIFSPADGIIEGYNRGGSTLTIKHTASNGKEFLTFYQHLNPKFICEKINLIPNAFIRRGEKIGRVEERDAEGNPRYTHLHFGVAVKGPGGIINGVIIPPLWYMIDPFGVYDYRRNRGDLNNYNYLPNNTLSVDVRGIIHAYVFRTNPPIGSLPTSTLECQFPPRLYAGDCFCDFPQLDCNLLTPWRGCWWECFTEWKCLGLKILILFSYLGILIIGAGEIIARLLKGKPGPLTKIGRFFRNILIKRGPNRN